MGGPRTSLRAQTWAESSRAAPWIPELENYNRLDRKLGRESPLADNQVIQSPTLWKCPGAERNGTKVRRSVLPSRSRAVLVFPLKETEDIDCIKPVELPFRTGYIAWLLQLLLEVLVGEHFL
jgi:hypothetical protein